MLIYAQFGIIQNLQMFPICQASFLVGTFFCRFLQQDSSNSSKASIEKKIKHATKLSLSFDRRIHLSLEVFLSQYFFRDCHENYKVLLLFWSSNWGLHYHYFWCPPWNFLFKLLFIHNWYSTENWRNITWIGQWNRARSVFFSPVTKKQQIFFCLLFFCWNGIIYI